MAVSSLVAASAGATVAEGNSAGWNKGPLDITWAEIANLVPSGTTATITGLGGYKYIKFIFNSVFFQTGNTNIQLRFNSDSTAGRYHCDLLSFFGTNGAVNIFSPPGGVSSDVMNFAQVPTFSGGFAGTMTLLNPSSTTSRKLVEFDIAGNDGSSVRLVRGTGIYHSTNAITSVTFNSTNLYNWNSSGTNSGILVFGGN